MPKQLDYTGRTFGRLKVIRKADAPPPTVSVKKHNHRYWVCICKCGREHVASSTNLRTGGTKSCGCLRREVAAQRHRKAPGEAGFKRLFNSYINNAKERSIAFQLTKEEFRELTGLPCFYCGSVPAAIKIDKRGRRTLDGWLHSRYTYNGIDRINNAQGYTYENSVPCCKRCNWGKRDLPLDQFVLWVFMVFSHTFGPLRLEGDEWVFVRRTTEKAIPEVKPPEWQVGG
jgi:hypothetical protein